jgi:hypothetical protein
MQAWVETEVCVFITADGGPGVCIYYCGKVARSRFNLSLLP